MGSKTTELLDIIILLFSKIKNIKLLRQNVKQNKKIIEELISYLFQM
jgi:hypothetical protein